jgi:Ankyrin repeats (many copies)
VLLDAGAQASERAIAAALGHRELAAVQALLDRGHPETAPIAAAMGRTERLAELLRAAAADERQAALGMAVINGRIDAAQMALDAGADPSGFLPVHAHSTPLHQAALAENLKLIDLLVSRGARTDVRDGLWDGTPLDWATHQGKVKAKAFLENWS